MLLRYPLALLTLSALGACSSAAGTGQQGAPSGTGAGSGAGGDGQLFGGNGGSDPGAGSTSGTGATINGTGAGTGITTRDVGNCNAIVSQGEQLPLDIYVMFDISLSMSADVGNGQNRLDAERAALETFIADPASAGMKVGIGYFGNQTIGTTSCNPADFATPEVPIAPLPANAPPIKTSLDSKSPTGETPTPAAIGGAAQYAKQWAQAHPADVTVILLVTDGVPEAPLSAFLGCNPTLPDAVAAAANSAGQPPQIPVYVLGVGPSLDNLTQIAQSGGTQQAYLVDGGNVEQAVLDALNKIRGSAQVPCTYTIPPPSAGQTFDPAKVNIQYTPPGGQPGIVYGVADQASCDPAQGGWYYGDSQTIKLCDATCTQVTSQAGGIIDVALGCKTQNRVK